MQEFSVPFISGVTKHEALISCADIFLRLLFKYCLGDVLVLGFDIFNNIAIIAIDPNLLRCESNLLANFPHYLLKAELIIGDGNLAEKYNL